MDFERQKAEALVDDCIQNQGYIAARVLEDGSVAALVPLIFTTGLCLGVNRTGYDRRYCFKDPLDAIQQFSLLKSEDDEPVGFIARRPEIREEDGSYKGAVK
jgi:hypothetical protein